MDSPAEPKGKKLINYRPLFELALGIMLGVGSAGLLAGTGRLLLAAVFAIGAAGLFIINRRASYLLFAALVGLSLASVSLPTAIKNGEYSLRGIVIDIETDKNNTTVLTLKNTELNGSRLNKNCLLTVSGAAICEVGDFIEATAYVRMPQRKFGTYNELHARLAEGVGSIARAGSISVVSHDNAPFTQFLNSVRQTIVRSIDKSFGTDSDIFSALVIGKKSEITEERYSVYRTAGTAHLLAISGFHMGIVSGAVGALIPKRKRTVRLIIVSAAMLIYCTVAAYSPGFVRAAIMSVCFMLAGSLERRSDQLSALSLAAIIILILNPYQLYSIGFQFSFTACFGIALYLRPFTEALMKIKLKRGLASSIAVCVSATLGTIMFQLRYYNSFSLYTIIGNIVAVPLFSPIVILGIIVTIVGTAAPGLAALISAAPRGLLFAVEKFLSLLENLPFANIEFASPPAISCVIYLAILFVLSEYVLRPGKRRLEFALPLIVLFTIPLALSIIKT